MRDIPGVVAAWTGGSTAREQEVADGPSEPPEAPEEEVAEDPGEPPEAPEEEVASRDSEPAEAPEASARNRVSLSSATFEDLRALGLSVTQATRLLSRREKQGGFESVDDLDELPGFPSSLRAELKSQVEV